MKKTLHDFVLLKELEKKEEMTAGGILLTAGGAHDPFIRAEVLDVGPGRRTLDGTLVPVSVECGQHVLVTREACRDVMENGEKLFLAREEAIPRVIGNGE